VQSDWDWPIGGYQVTGGFSFLSPSVGTEENAGRVVVKVSQRKYKDWIAEFSSGDLSGRSDVPR
jgi:hypothetical protein